MSVLDRTTLETSSLSDLHAIASELSIDGYRRLRKPDLIAALLGHQDGGEAAGETVDGAAGQAVDSAAAETVDDETTGEQTPGTAAKRRRGRRGGRSRSTAAGDDEQAPQAGADQAPEPPAASKPEDELVEGVVELLPNGSGFLRLAPPEPSDDDVYISAAQVKRCELIGGDRVSGPRRAPHRSERFPSLVRIDTVNGRPVAELADRGRFDELPVAFPSTRFKLGSTDATLKAIDVLAPFGRGSRVVITGGAWAGKSHVLRLLAGPLAGQKEVTVLVALAGVRPEELADWSETPVQPDSTATLGASADAQAHVVELVVEQAKRLAVRGDDAIVLIDTLDGLPPLAARKALAAARNLAGGGSLTVIATASEPPGGETTVITLDRRLAMAGEFPALDVAGTATLRPELLVSKAALTALAKERAKAA